MNHFNEYDVVRVVQLDRPNRHHDGTTGVKRPPQIGDLGTIVHIAPGSPGKNSWYVVECVDKNGLTVWLSDFIEDELELVEAIK